MSRASEWAQTMRTRPGFKIEDEDPHHRLTAQLLDDGSLLLSTQGAGLKTTYGLNGIAEPAPLGGLTWLPPNMALAFGRWLVATFDEGDKP